jgi:hypothetical protein
MDRLAARLLLFMMLSSCFCAMALQAHENLPLGTSPAPMPVCPPDSPDCLQK